MNGRVLLLPVALKDGLPILISEIPSAESGKACGCICPNCGGSLVAIKGPFQQQHFTHKRVDYSYDTENATLVGLLEIARAILQQEGKIMLPGLEAIDSSVDDYRADFETFRALSRRRQVAFPEIVPVVQVRLVKNPEEPVPHLVAETTKGRIQIVLQVRRRSGKPAQNLLPDGDSTVIEIDLSRSTYPEILDRDSLRTIFVFNTIHKRWLQCARLTCATKELFEENRATILQIQEQRGK